MQNYNQENNYTDLGDAYNRGEISIDALFDQDPEDAPVQYDFNPMTVWDNEFQKKVYREHTEADFLENPEDDVDPLVLALSAIRFAHYFTRESMGFHKQHTVSNGRKPHKSAYSSNSIEMYASAKLEFADRFQEIFLGILHAAKKFDNKRDAKFTTYAAYIAERYLQRAIINKGLEHSVRFPVGVYDDIRKVRRTVRSAEDDQVAPKLDTLWLEKDLSEVHVRRIAQADVAFKNISLEYLAEVCEREADCKGSENLTLSDRIIDVQEQVIFEEFIDDFTNDELVVDALEVLRTQFMASRVNPVEVVRLTYGLNDEEPWMHTLESIGKKYGVTRERIRQVLLGCYSILRCHNTYSNISTGTEETTSSMRSELKLTEVERVAVAIEEHIIWDQASDDELRLIMRTGNETKKKFQYQEDWS